MLASLEMYMFNGENWNLLNWMLQIDGSKEREEEEEAAAKFTVSKNII